MSVEKRFHPVHKTWLLPGEAVPCAIYFYFRGRYVKALSEGNSISLDLLSKLSKVEHSYAYIESINNEEFDAWKRTRHPHLVTNENSKQSKANKAANEHRKTFQSYAQKHLSLKNNSSEKLTKAVSTANKLFRKVIDNPLLDWYFERGYENLEIHQHNARVTYLCILFSLSHELLDLIETENLAFSAIIHELEGDPKATLDNPVAQQVLEKLEAKKQPIPAEVIAIMQDHDELVNGKGLPKQKQSHEITVANKVFSICNHFDHYRLQNFGKTRRERLSKTISTMEKKSDRFDSFILEEFTKFITEEFELVS